MSSTLRVSGRKFALPTVAAAQWVFTVRPGGWIIAESPAGERHRFMMHEARGKIGASLGGKLLYGDLIEERAQGAGAAAGTDADLTAQFPGKVRKLLVANGQKVAAGDPLVLVEAMKMEFTVKAPFAGTVKRILVTEAQPLSPGDRFLEIEADG